MLNAFLKILGLLGKGALAIGATSAVSGFMVGKASNNAKNGNCTIRHMYPKQEVLVEYRRSLRKDESDTLRFVAKTKGKYFVSFHVVVRKDTELEKTPESFLWEVFEPNQELLIRHLILPANICISIQKNEISESRVFQF